MKKLFAFVLCACVVLCVSACTGLSANNEIATTAPTQGNIETKTLYLPLSVEYYVLPVSLNGEPVSTPKLSYTVEYKYDANKFLTQIDTIQDGQVTKQLFTTCDKHGNVIKTREVSAGDDNVVEITYTRDTQGRVIHRETYSGGRFSYAVDLFWDDQGNLIKQDDGVSLYEFTYNDKGEEISYRHYWNGVLHDYKTTTLDAEGRVITSSICNADGSYVFYDEFSYGSDSVEQTYRYGPEDTCPDYYIYRYDAHGNLSQVDRWGLKSVEHTRVNHFYITAEVPVDSIRQPYEV